MPEWTTTDAQRLREFLAANPNFQRELTRRIPKRTQTETMEAKSLNAERREGARDIIEEITKLSEYNETPERPPANIDSHRAED